MLEIVRRDNREFTFYLYDSDGLAYDLTDCSLYATAKSSYEDTDANAKILKTLTISAPHTGKAVLPLIPSDTQYLLGNYYFDLQLVDITAKVRTILRTTLKVTPDYTIRVSV